MKARLIFTLKYFLFWICAFIAARFLFMLYQHSQSFQLDFFTWIKVFIHGLKLDLSTAGYFTLFPAIVLVLTSFFNYKPAWYAIAIYTCLVIFVFLIITFVDFEAYKYWGVRLDSAPLRFLGKPKETLASTSVPTLVIYLTALAALTWLLFSIYKKRVAATIKNMAPGGLKSAMIMILTTIVLLLPVRGGLGVSPVNTGSVYFSKNAFANHAAINVTWNFGHSLIEGKKVDNPYVFFKEKGYEIPFKNLYHYSDKGPVVLKTQKPDILLIIMESFSAKLIEPLGGVKGVTPRFNEMCKHGVFFTNIYSTDSRTDKGLATVISGYPVLEAIPILSYPEKTQNLPFLSKSLAKRGYHSSFLYGGDVDFANIRSYLINGNINNIISDTEFPVSQRNSKWGVHDHLVYNRFLKEIEADTGSWFKIMLSLSNHEPFEIPAKQHFGNKNLTTKFYSAAYYADSCLGDFISRFSKTDKWNNTLIIIVADHGTRLPKFDAIYEPRKHHIPLLWTGGAVLKDTIVSKTGSQADLAVTLLNQLGISTDEYILGKNLLAKDSQSFAFYSIKNGIAMITDSSGFGYDFITNGLSYSYGKTDSSHISMAKALQQYIFQNYLDLSKH